jgi:hypothetical protein
MAGCARAVLVAVIAVAATATACTGSLAPGVCSDGVCGSQRTITRTFQETLNLNLDLLFVIDDTDAIAPWVDNLRAGYPAMAHLLETLPQGAPDAHVGFVRASRCAPQTRARDCGVTAPHAFLRNELCGAISNFAGSFADTFTCMADFGMQACSTAQPFQALRDALAQPPPAGWEGFLRPDAALQIVIIAGRDDASGASPLELAAFVKALKPDPQGILVSVIGPVGAPRLTELAQQFGANGLLAELAGDPAVALYPLTQTISVLIEPACLGPVLDVDPVAPGLQADCTFLDTVVARDGSRTTTALPACDTATPPCWRLTEYGSCTVAEVDRGADWCPSIPTSTRLECLSATR